MADKTTVFGGPFLAFPRWVSPYLKNDHIAKAVLLEMLMYMHPQSQTVTTSYQHIADQIGVDRRTVIRAVNRLASLGVLVKRHRGSKTHHMTNLFIVNFNNPEALEVVSPQTLPSVTGDTRGGDTGDTTLVSPVTPKQEHNNKSNNKNNRTKKGNSRIETIEVDRRFS